MREPPTDLTDLVLQLREAGGDFEAVEVKSAAAGFPESLTPTLSAMANLPGGGLIVLGLDEATGFRPVALKDAQALKQALRQKARSYEPPVRLTIRDGEIEGHRVIAATVHECDPSAKPCRVAASGKAYLRSYDGDYELSAIEQQAFLAQRRPPHFDRQAVAGSSVADLDDDLVELWRAAARVRDPRGLGRFTNDDELLHRSGVVTPEGTPTVAGLLALGRYPQQWFPRYVIQVGVEPRADDPPGTRATNVQSIAGPIPMMLDEALTWARRSFATRIVAAADGTVSDVPAYPIEAFRELASNALVHRDLDDWSQGLAVEIRLRADRLVIQSPGGLYGITVDRLGRAGVTSARNALLIAICQDVRSSDTGSRVTEALASGLPTVVADLNRDGLPPAHFGDSGTRFTVILRQPKAPGTKHQLTETATRIYDALAGAPATVSELETALNLAAPNIRKALRQLRAVGLVRQNGGPGQPTTYDRIAE